MANKYQEYQNLWSRSIIRPKISNNIIMPDAAVVHAINYISKFEFFFDYLVFIQPHLSRNKTELDLAIKRCINKNLDIVFLQLITSHFHQKKRKNFTR